jgi:hypothetical protein
MLAGATAPGPADQTPTDPPGTVRQQLDPALQKARDALAADRKSDLAAALSALLEAAEEAIATLLDQVPSSPPPIRPAGSRATLQARCRKQAPLTSRRRLIQATWELAGRLAELTFACLLFRRRCSRS